MNQQVHMVQGMYFQERTGFGVGISDEPGIGLAVLVSRGMTENMFSGMFGFDYAAGERIGYLKDTAGASVIHQLEYSDTEFSFTKQYDGRADPIHYEFVRRGDIWVGHYEGLLVGRGRANCIVTAVPDEMFNFAL